MNYKEATVRKQETPITADSTYTSVKSFREVAGVKTSRRPITCRHKHAENKDGEVKKAGNSIVSWGRETSPLTFSCFMCLSSRSSLYVLLAWIMD